MNAYGSLVTGTAPCHDSNKNVLSRDGVFSFTCTYDVEIIKDWLRSLVGTLVTNLKCFGLVNAQLIL